MHQRPTARAAAPHRQGHLPPPTTDARSTSSRSRGRCRYSAPGGGRGRGQPRRLGRPGGPEASAPIPQQDGPFALLDVSNQLLHLNPQGLRKRHPPPVGSPGPLGPVKLPVSPIIPGGDLFARTATPGHFNPSPIVSPIVSSSPVWTSPLGLPYRSNRFIQYRPDRLIRLSRPAYKPFSVCRRPRSNR